MGRPTKDDDRKISTPVRCLVSAPVFKMIVRSMTMRKMSMSEWVRLAIFKMLFEDRLLPRVKMDETFDGLRKSGKI